MKFLTFDRGTWGETEGETPEEGDWKQTVEALGYERGASMGAYVQDFAELGYIARARGPAEWRYLMTIDICGEFGEPVLVRDVLPRRVRAGGGAAETTAGARGSKGGGGKAVSITLPGWPATARGLAAYAAAWTQGQPPGGKE
jgi:hypothetical protein